MMPQLGMWGVWTQFGGVWTHYGGVWTHYGGVWTIMEVYRPNLEVYARVFGLLHLGKKKYTLTSLGLSFVLF